MMNFKCLELRHRYLMKTYHPDIEGLRKTIKYLKISALLPKFEPSLFRRPHCFCCAKLYGRTPFILDVASPYRLCGLVVGVFGYRSGGPGSIPATTRKKSSGSGTGSTQPREYN
jgi:hypothetical protein